MITESKDVFEEKLKRLFQKKSSTEMDLILNCLSLIIYGTASNVDMVELYHLVKPEDFIKVVSLFDGRTVKFPTKKELRNSLMLALLYYYKEIMGMTWEEIKKELPFEISSISYGIQIKNLNNFIRQKMQEIMRGMDDETGN